MTTPQTASVMPNWPSSKVNGCDYQAKALAQTHHLLCSAESHFKLRLTEPEIRFDLRGRAAGMVLFRPGRVTVIRYNHTLLNENGDAFIARTVPHEVSHLVARERYGPTIRPHGEEWREIMAFFGADTSRCHDFPVNAKNGRRMRYFDYRCGCREHRLSAIRHHRSLEGTEYLCRRCGSPLRLITAE